MSTFTNSSLDICFIILVSFNDSDDRSYTLSLWSEREDDYNDDDPAIGLGGLRYICEDNDRRVIDAWSFVLTLVWVAFLRVLLFVLKGETDSSDDLVLTNLPDGKAIVFNCNSSTSSVTSCRVLGTTGSGNSFFRSSTVLLRFHLTFSWSWCELGRSFFPHYASWNHIVF